MSADGTGLREHRRDSGLPGIFGQPDLAPPDEGRVIELVEAQLSGPDGPRVRRATWVYARWKPGVSLTSAHALSLSDGSAVTVAVKRYRGDKAGHLAARGAGRPTATRPGWIADRAERPDLRLALWVPEGDRALGLSELLSTRRVASVFREAGLLDPALVRKRRTRFEWLRYKPERRAVLRLDLQLRDTERSHHALAYRVLPKEEATRVLVTRRAFERCGGAELAAPLAGGHGPYGLLAEPWLDLRAAERTLDPEGASAVGALLARLHQLDVPDELPRHAPAPVQRLSALLPGHDLAGLTWPTGRGSSTWLHGDLHADQWGTTTDGPRLLDLDALAIGDPVLDLSSWIADQLAEGDDRRWEDACAPLLEAYAEAGGHPPPLADLERAVACALACRAAGAMRRLELGAGARAARLLTRARELASGAA